MFVFDAMISAVRLSMGASLRGCWLVLQLQGDQQR
jgi:hypothetical protein